MFMPSNTFQKLTPVGRETLLHLGRSKNYSCLVADLDQHGVDDLWSSRLAAFEPGHPRRVRLINEGPMVAAWAISSGSA